MKLSHDLVRSYAAGRLTRDGLFLNLLSLTRKRDLRDVLESLSPDLLAPLRAFVLDHRPRAKVFNGPMSRMENVRLIGEMAPERCPNR